MAKREREAQEFEGRAAATGRTVDLFLDSGVFSAWNRGTTLNLKDYCKYIERNKSALNAYATMDVIPGKFDQKRTQKQVEESAKGSYKNQQIMKDRGLTPIPIFHQGENLKWLEQYIKDGEPYIGISTAKDLKPQVQRIWLDHIFTMITDTKGVPFVKTHGFGVTSPPLLLRYPWFTTDSTTWSLGAGYGVIYVPPMNGGVPDFTKVPTRIIMSGRLQKGWMQEDTLEFRAWSVAKRQYEGLSAPDKEWVDAWLTYCNITPQEARYKSSSRRAACLKYYVGFSNNFKTVPFSSEFRHKRTGLLEKPYDLHVDIKPQPLWPRMNVIMATMMYNGQFSRILNAAGARHRLVSYWETMKRDDELLHKFVQHGITDLHYEPKDTASNWNETYVSKRTMMFLERIKNYGQNETD
jgi:hypothetical protein